MPRVRASLLLNTVAFVCEVYGEAAHERVMKTLDARSKAEINSLREAAWVDVDELMAYQNEAAGQLAPADPEFHRQAGLYSGKRQRSEGGFRPLVEDPSTATKMASVYWRALFDTGSVEIVESSRDSVLAEVRDFPTSRELCLRITGGLEGALQGAERPARVTEERCSLDGHPHCVLRVRWLDPEPPDPVG